MHLRDANTAPPGGWKFHEARTDHWMNGITSRQLITRVAQHRNNMGFAVISPGFSDLQSELEDWICRSLPEADSKQKCAEVKRAKTLKPGDVLAAVILQLTGKNARTCSKCGRRVMKMNSWGWAGSIAHLSEITGWLKEEAAERGHPMDDNTAAALFNAAWEELKEKHKLTDKEKQENDAHAEATNP